jgi:hypothetical protein
MVKAWLRGFGVAIVVLGGSAPAATVGYRLELSEATGQFDLFASASPDDNGGIAAYSVDLVGAISSLDHVSAYTSLAVNDQDAEGSAGFSFLRSASGLPWVHASQDTITATPHLLYGLGQTAGSLSQLGVNSLASAAITTWSADLKIASGFYDPTAGPLRIDYSSRRTQANVFQSFGSPRVIAADVLYDARFAATPATPVLPPPVTAPPIQNPLGPTLPSGPPLASATVEYRIELGTTPGEFKLFGSTKGGGAGLAAYGVELTGPITSLNHLSPTTSMAENAASVSGSAGFSLLRSADGSTSVHASQDTITATPHLLYGLGQQPGSLAAAGLNPLTSVESDAWDAELLLATGTFDATLGSIAIDYSSSITGANVFKSVGSGQTMAATVTYDSRYAFVPPAPPTPEIQPPVVVPEPPLSPPTSPELLPPVAVDPSVLPPLASDPAPLPELPAEQPSELPLVDVPNVIVEVLPPAPETAIGEWIGSIERFPVLWQRELQLWDGATLIAIDDPLTSFVVLDADGRTHSLSLAMSRFEAIDGVDAMHSLNLGDSLLAFASTSAAAETQIPEPTTAGLVLAGIVATLSATRHRP